MTRRIDHLVLAVHDLDAAARLYDDLGFQVGAQNRHPWGTENRIVQFRSSFLELITVGQGAEIPPHAPGVFSFGAFVRDYLARREGLAMVVLDSDDARADAQAFARAGVGAFAPFDFERKGRRADGRETHVAFSLAFAMDDRLPMAAFFVCQQHFPQAFWSPELQQHANGVTNVSEVRLAVDDPAHYADFLAGYSGVTPREGRCALAEGGALVAEPGGAQALTGYSLALSDPAALEARAARAGLGLTRSGAGWRLSADQACGCDLRFVPAGD